MAQGPLATLTSINVVAPILAALSALVLLAVLLHHRRLPLDRPNERSLHSKPVPRVGGLAVMLAIAVGWVCLPTAVPWFVWIPVALLFGLSFLDDLANLPAAVRLLAHLLAAAPVSGTLVLPDGDLATALVLTLGIAWMTNLYNFMDGSDGLAGGMTLFGFTGYAIAAWIGGAYPLALASMCVSAASAVFLCFNFYPARVFLGDAGSIPIGFLAAALGVQGWAQELWPAWFPILVFSPFIVDASVTLLRRVMRREKIWQAHRDHYYQRLVRSGWGHRRTALAEYGLMAACVFAALVGMTQSAAMQLALLTAWAAGYAVLATLVDRVWHKHAKSLSVNPKSDKKQTSRINDG